MYKLLKNTEKFIDKAFDMLVVLVLVVGIYYAVDAVLLYQDADASSVAAYKPTAEDPLAYKKISEDCVGWVAMYNTGLDYPVVQGKDNNEYLNKDAFGAYSLSGAIFLDSRNDPGFTDSYSLVYGHHMDGGYMFGVLDEFGEKKYFDEHRDGELVVDGKFHKIRSFGFAHTDASEGMIFNPDIAGDRAEWAHANCDIYEEPESDRILALTTCKSPASTRRTILLVAIID